ncbi:alanine racemase [Sedimentibacter acidaminivorans]|uniref:Alanine racemase n=1 Tax=Sedimentibacter acidaminivorans TaxID=913099 RepID=A0ABS4GAA2_9FIRM|nr:alanine racemase [Sedimentibacter acidaminivorans]MBP1924462.1 alanine racemase [Sedimentibacter acidaminivorans]
MENQPLLRDTIIEVNLDNIAYNMKKIKEVIGEDIFIAAVVKANGYGHGAVDIAPTIMENGGEYLAVATLTEALELRKKYEDYKIFIMGYTPDEYLDYVVNNNITQTIFSLSQAEILNDLGKKNRKKPVIHIKYDTGFNRLGFRDCKESIDEIDEIFKLKNIYVEGIFSHFALAGRIEDDLQYNKFVEAVNLVEQRGWKFKFKHICDSISGIDYPEFRLNMIRPGAIIYGLKSYKDESIMLKQAMTFKTKIYHIKALEKGEGVSYDYFWKADKNCIVGTLPFGYADGYPRNLRDKGIVTIHGKKAPIIGVICMDQCMVDLTDIPEACVGDEVIIYGDGLNNTLDIHQISQLAATNKNEIACRITRRTPRVYIKGEKVVKVSNYLL